MKSKLIKLSLLITLIIGLVGCAPLIKFEQPIQTNYSHLEEGKSLGQTFTAHFDGLQGISLYIQTDQPGDSIIEISLKETPESNTIISTSTRNLAEFNKNGYYVFPFEPQKGSNLSDYYMQIELSGPGSLLIGTAPGDTYLNGTLYRNQSPLDAQLTFRLIYDKPTLFLGLIRETLSWIAYLLIAAFLFIFPGWVILSIYWNKWGELYWGSKLGLAVGISLSIYPLLFLWTDIFNLHLGALYAWLPPIFAAGLLIWKRHKQLSSIQISLSSIKHFFSWPNVTYIFLLILIFGVRFWVIRSITLPLWGDSYQHTMISQLMIHNGGLFTSWQPYAALETFTYHFGFHSLTAIFQWITNVSAAQSVLITGQILNGLAIIALFPVAFLLKKNPWSGIITILFAGLIFSMPMFYVNWGRYTQLTGLILLATFTFFIWSIAKTKSSDKIHILISVVVLAALALSHYRVLIFAVLLMPVLLLTYSKEYGLWNIFKRFFIISLGAFLLFLPWFINLFSGLLFNIVEYQAKNPPPNQGISNQTTIGIGNLFEFLPVLLWILMPVLIGWALWRRSKAVAIIAFWWFIVFLAANPQWFNLPGEDIISSFTVLIAIYFPASLILGEAGGWLAGKWAIPEGKKADNEPYKYYKSSRFALLAISILLLGTWGAIQHRNTLKPNKFSLTTRPDERAAKWIQENMPQESSFLINSFFAYNGSLIVGADGGWWLPLLAEREITVPPLNYGSEKGPFPNYQRWINELTATIQQKGINNPQVLKMLADRNITNIYVGQRQGEVNTNLPLLNIEELLSSSHYQPIFHQDRVWIFEIDFASKDKRH